MLIDAPLQVEDDIVGQNMTNRPQYNGMMGTIVGIIEERRKNPGRPRFVGYMYQIIWADGARSIQRAHQLRHLTMFEEAEAKARTIELLLHIAKK